MKLPPGHIATQILRVVGREETLKGCPLGTDRGPIAMAWVKFCLVGPGEDTLAQRYEALSERIRRNGVAGSARKDGVSDDDLAI